jgi:hypothetical protein
MHAVVLRIVRWTTLVFVASSFLMQPAFAKRDAGWIEDSRCCCPDTSKCKCEHDGDHESVLTTCGNTGHYVTPITTSAAVPEVRWEPVIPVVLAPIYRAVGPPLEDVPPAQLQRPG